MSHSKAHFDKRSQHARGYVPSLNVLHIMNLYDIADHRRRTQPSDWNSFSPTAPALFSGKALWSGNIGAKIDGRSSYIIPDDEPETITEATVEIDNVLVALPILDADKIALFAAAARLPRTDEAKEAAA